MATSESELGLMDGIWALERGGKKVQSSLFFHEEHADPLHRPGKRAPWIAWALAWGGPSMQEMQRCASDAALCNTVHVLGHPASRYTVHKGFEAGVSPHARCASVGCLRFKNSFYYNNHQRWQEGFIISLFDEALQIIHQQGHLSSSQDAGRSNASPPTPPATDKYCHCAMLRCHSHKCQRGSGGKRQPQLLALCWEEQCRRSCASACRSQTAGCMPGDDAGGRCSMRHRRGRCDTRL
jgi:hypothetical protein